MLDRAQRDMETPASDLLVEAEASLYALAEVGGAATGGFVDFQAIVSGAVADAVAAFEAGGKLVGVSTGLIDLDSKLGGMHPSDLIVLAGRPSMGKTALATNVGFDVANAGGVVGFFSLEMSGEQLAMRILADRSGVSGDRIRKGEIDEGDIRAIRQAAEEIATLPFYTDATGGIGIHQLTARARRLKRLHGLDLIIIDYLQLITTKAKAGTGRVGEVTEITGGLKALAKELGVPVIALSQLSRKVEEREDKRPQLSDLRESGSIEQDADSVMFVFREEYYLGRAEPKAGSPQHLTWQDDMQRCGGQADLIIGKNRHRPDRHGQAVVQQRHDEVRQPRQLRPLRRGRIRMTTKGPKPDAWMPMFVADYMADTSRLTLEQHGAYLILIFDYWRNGAPPEDDAVLAQILRLDRKSWLKLRPAIAPFFQIEGGAWRHKRVDAEIIKAQGRSDKAHTRASVAAQARWAKDRGEDTSEHGSRSAPGDAPSMPQALLEDVLEECPPSSPSPKEERISEANASSGGSAEPSPPAAEPKAEEQVGEPDLLDGLLAAAAAPKPKPRWTKDLIFLAAWDACTKDMRTRSNNRDKTWPVWVMAAVKAGGPEPLLASLKAYLAGDKDILRGTGGPGFHLWLKDGKWEHWLPQADAAVDAPAWVGSAALRTACVEAKSEGWARSYIDQCGWRDLPTPTLIPAKPFAATVIATEVGSILRRMGVDIEKAAA